MAKHIAPRDDIPVDLDYQQAAPNDPIELGTHRVRIAHGSYVSSADAVVRMDFVPTPRLLFQFDHLPYRWAKVHEPVTLSMENLGGSFLVLFVHRGMSSTRSDISAALLPSTSRVAPCSTPWRMTRCRFPVFNFPNFFGGSDFVVRGETKRGDAIGGSSRTLCGEVVLAAAGWGIRLTALTDTGRRVCALERDGGYHLTHSAEVTRGDGSDFSDAEAEGILACVHWFLSFAIGRWAGVAFPTGAEPAGSIRPVSWGLPKVEANLPSGSRTWFDHHHGACLAAAFPGFFRLWNSPPWADALRRVISFYLRANSEIGVDSGIIMAQASLEHLAWTYVVKDRRAVSDTAFKQRGGLTAANKLRLLASMLGIPLTVPGTCPALKAPTGHQTWSDGADAITALRNGVVHPDTKHVLGSDAYVQGLRFALWFEELAILRLCGYDGEYANRLAQRWIGQTEQVPWVE